MLLGVHIKVAGSKLDMTKALRKLFLMIKLKYSEEQTFCMFIGHVHITTNKPQIVLKNRPYNPQALTTLKYSSRKSRLEYCTII